MSNDRGCQTAAPVFVFFAMEPEESGICDYKTEHKKEKQE